MVDRQTGIPPKDRTHGILPSAFFRLAAEAGYPGRLTTRCCEPDVTPWRAVHAHPVLFQFSNNASGGLTIVRAQQSDEPLVSDDPA